jgi:hypothetical protein
MCKKLMFLISFVALLGLVNVASSDTICWDGGGATSSFCEAENWDGDVVPGPDDTACGDTGKDILIDCDVTVKHIRLPAYDPPDGETIGLDIISGDIVAESWRCIWKGDDVNCTVNATGGSMTLTGGDKCGWTEDGGTTTFGHYNLGGDFVLDVAAGPLRAGDNGGNVFMTFTDDAIISVAGYTRLGDDGAGGFVFAGNVSCNFLGKYETFDAGLEIGCRDNANYFYLQDNAEVYIEHTAHLAKHDDNPGMVYVSGGTMNANWFLLKNGTDLDMTGGLIIARDKFSVKDGSTAAVSGGEIRIESNDTLEIDSGSSIDLCGGVLKIKGNAMADIGTMACDGSGKLTGCGTAAGVVAEYDGTYTVVYAADVDPKKAYCPVRANGAERVPSLVSKVILCWQPGSGVGSRGRHLVYFGSDCDAVANAGPGDPENVCVNRAIDLCCDVGNLPLWECFCWRVDEFNEDGTTSTGDLWTFCTGCEDIPGDCNRDCLLNFEDYATTVDDFGEQIYWP